jgi:hypothetical protein
LLRDLLPDLELDRPEGRAGTFAPFSRASESPIAIACLRLVTFPPLPLLRVPFLRLRMALSTVSCAFFPYLATTSPFCRASAQRTNGILTYADDRLSPAGG